VRDCSVHTEAGVVGKIDQGLLVYLGVGKEDTDKQVAYMADKIANLRIFRDENGKMNRSVLETGDGILVVSQFTLFGDVRGQRRPSYINAAEPDYAKLLYHVFISALSAFGIYVEKGEFGSFMEVSYTNMGPITILVDSEKKF
jgi:D-tyrosyl-tRNA(Tyr) deacylase